MSTPTGINFNYKNLKGVIEPLWPLESKRRYLIVLSVGAVTFTPQQRSKKAKIEVAIKLIEEALSE